MLGSTHRGLGVLIGAGALTRAGSSHRGLGALTWAGSTHGGLGALMRAGSTHRGLGALTWAGEHSRGLGALAGGWEHSRGLVAQVLVAGPADGLGPLPVVAQVPLHHVVIPTAPAAILSELDSYEGRVLWTHSRGPPQHVHTLREGTSRESGGPIPSPSVPLWLLLPKSARHLPPFSQLLLT
jgi:hypothetical protein